MYYRFDKTCMKKQSFVYRNGLSLVIIILFVLALCGQAFTGWKEYNEELNGEHVAELSLVATCTQGILYRPLLKTFKVNFCKWLYM